jgi:hypothetical protein
MKIVSFNCCGFTKKDKDANIVNDNNDNSFDISARFNYIKGFITHAGENELLLTRVHKSKQYELQIDKIDYWTFDNNLICVSGITDETKLVYPLSHYIGKSIYQFTDEENIQFWIAIVKDTLKGKPSRHTLYIREQLSYVETKTIYHCKETNEIYGCLILIIPYLPKYSITNENANK